MDEYESLVGYENLYRINKQGDIWSCHFGKIMKPLVTEDGYLFVSLTKDNVRKKSYIARLLALQYIPNDDPLKIQIDHINRNNQNNSLDNLRWVTKKENLLNKNRNGSIYEDKRKNGKIYWKGCHYTYDVDGKKHQHQKTALKREDVEEWLNKIKANI